jgi:hypothetical protein
MEIPEWLFKIGHWHFHGHDTWNESRISSLVYALRAYFKKVNYKLSYLHIITILYSSPQTLIS